ncbi:MAG: FIG00458786: hypothetical protein [uncultured Paraburkholderia sp.]|nr:MAG: FIG00458786: hypothetical protein [uncultured Paraburkholderia sp.]CAH2926761.1 MAG: FIG00458786: hypothetical protein [uncultured Paraburkholderia sp.]
MSESIRIYEPIYAQGQVLSEKSFHALVLKDNAHAAWREFYILVDMYRKGLHRQQQFTGLFSPKFSLKARIDGKRFLDYVQADMDADVCLINPLPQLAYFSYNAWMQGEHAHPGLVERSQLLLDACAIPWTLRDAPRQGPAMLCYCNFWVGTERFWEEYVGKVLEPISTFLETQSSTEAARAVLELTVHSDDAPFLPFIAERLFSTFLSLTPELKIAAYPIEGDDVLDYCVSDFEKDIVRYMRKPVEAADKAGSFAADQIGLMNLLCQLSQKYVRSHFSINPHPHTGQPIDFDRKGT